MKSREGECKETEEGEKAGCFIRCLEWMSFKLKLTEEGATPPNWRYIMLIFICLFCSSVSLTFLFPFLPEMILHFGYSENEKGIYGGLIASCVFAGRIFSSLFWGWLADLKGRKMVLLLTILLNGLSAGLFGFSVNLPMAMCLRFLCGIFNGIVSTAKAALYDVSDNTNQAVGMTFLSLSWGAGMVAGPLVGGVLATPCTKWPGFCSEDSLLGKYPFLLPSLFPTVVSIFVFILVFFKFEETLIRRKDESINVSQDGQEEEVDSLSQMKNLSQNVNGHRLLVNRSLSVNNELRHRPAHNLSTSAVSLSPEAEMSICLGKDVLSRQESNSKTTSEPDLPFIFSQRLDLADLDSHSLTVLSKSTSHIHNGGTTTPLTSQTPNGLPNGVRAPIYRPNGVNHKCSDVTVSSQPKVVLTVKDETANDSGIKSISSGTNTDPLLPQTETVPEEEHVCECCDHLFSLRCCICRNSSFHTLVRLSDVWASVLLYSVMSVVTIGVDDIFPVFASTRKDYGGMGFSTDEIGMALGFVTLPLLVLQVKIYPFLVAKLSVRKTFMAMAAVCLVTSQLIPTLRVLNNSPIWLWACLILIQVPFKIAVNCCFASTSLLINNSVYPEMAGQVNGFAMMTTAIGRSLAPIIAGMMFSWTVTYGQFIGAPFDTGFTFFVLGILYAVTLIECYFISPRLDQQKK